MLTPRLALEHAACGAVTAVLLMEVLIPAATQKLPFASGYVRADDLKSLVPLYVVAVLIISLMFSALERIAFESATGGVVFFGAMLAAIVAVHLADVRHRRTRMPIELDEAISGTIRALELGR